MRESDFWQMTPAEFARVAKWGFYRAALNASWIWGAFNGEGPTAEELLGHEPPAEAEP